MVWVVIATYQAEPWIERCLRSCGESEVPVRVVIVDNGSTDRTLEIAGRFPAAVVFPQSRNLGFGVANNIGIHHAREHGADWILLLNQDAFLFPDTLSTLIDVASRHPECGVLSPLHLASEEGRLDDAFAHHLRIGAEELLADLDRGATRELYTLDFVNAAVWLVRRSAFDRVGGFDPLFFVYGEDDDWCARAGRLGVSIGVVPAAKAIHLRGGESGSEEKKSAVGARANRIYLTHVLSVKRPHRAPWRSWARALADTVTGGAAALLRGRWGEASARLLGFSRALRRAVLIARHRERCRRPGPHWIA